MSLPDTKAKATAASNYAAVRKKIQRDRLLPWSSAPAFKIGDFVVNPLSLRSMVDLELAGNAFFTDDNVIEGDLAAYIWRHHPAYGDDGAQASFLKKLARSTDIDSLIAGVLSHLSAAFSETPEGAQFGGYSKSNTLPAIPSIASICSEYGAAFGIDPREVADVDLRIVFQCCRAIRLSKSDVKYLEPKELREAKSQYLKAHG